MAYTEVPEHNQILRPTRAYYAYCRNNQLNWKPKIQRQRAFETNIINIRDNSGDGFGDRFRAFGTNIINIGGGSGNRFRGLKTNWGCDACNIPLYKIENCWDQ